MSSDLRVHAHIDRQPISDYIKTPPDPVASISDYNVKIALNQLDEAAKVATTRDVAGRSWVPGLAIVVVGHKKEVLHCDGHGMKRIDGNATVGPDTVFP